MYLILKVLETGLSLYFQKFRSTTMPSWLEDFCNGIIKSYITWCSDDFSDVCSFKRRSNLPPNIFFVNLSSISQIMGTKWSWKTLVEVRCDHKIGVIDTVTGPALHYTLLNSILSICLLLEKISTVSNCCSRNNRFEADSIWLPLDCYATNPVSNTLFFSFHEPQYISVSNQSWRRWWYTATVQRLKTRC